jgi:hypothetical protein
MAVVVQLVIFLGAIGMAIQSIGYLTTPIVTSPGIMPLLVSTAGALIAGMLLVLDVVRGNISATRIRESLQSSEFRVRAAKATGWLFLATTYAVATPFVGFTWATLAFLGIALTIFARLSWWRTTFVAMAMATLVPITFRHLFFTIVP